MCIFVWQEEMLPTQLVIRDGEQLCGGVEEHPLSSVEIVMLMTNSVQSQVQLITGGDGYGRWDDDAMKRVACEEQAACGCRSRCYEDGNQLHDEKLPKATHIGGCLSWEQNQKSRCCREWNREESLFKDES